MRFTATNLFLALGFVSCATIKLKDKAPMKGKVGTPYLDVFEFENVGYGVGGLIVENQQLPPGLKLEQLEDGDRFQIHGIPSKPGTFEFPIEAWTNGTNFSSGQHFKGKLQIVIAPQ